MIKSSFKSQERSSKAKTGLIEILSILATGFFLLENIIGFYWALGTKFNWHPEQYHTFVWYTPLISTFLFLLAAKGCYKKNWPKIFLDITCFLQIGVVINVNLLMSTLWELNGMK